MRAKCLKNRQIVWPHNKVSVYNGRKGVPSQFILWRCFFALAGRGVVKFSPIGGGDHEVVRGVKVLSHPFDRNETTGIPPSSADADTSPRGQNIHIGPRIKFSPTGGVAQCAVGGTKKAQGENGLGLFSLLRPRETLLTHAKNHSVGNSTLSS